MRLVLALAAVLLVAACGGTHFSAHPGPPAGDVRITSCGLDPALHTGEVGGVIANSTGTSADYVVHLDFLSASGAELDSAMHAETGVGAGDKVSFRATGVESYNDKVSCRVTAVQRTAR